MLASNATADEQEGVPVSLMEAMASLVPVVATDSGGTGELSAAVQVCSYRSPIAPHSRSHAKHHHGRRAAVQLALAGRRRVVDSFDVKVVAAELRDRFAGCAADRARRPRHTILSARDVRRRQSRAAMAARSPNGARSYRGAGTWLPRPGDVRVEPLEPAFRGAPVKRIGAFTAQRRSWPGRAAAESLMAVKLAAIASRARPQVLVASSPSMFLGPSCLAAARARGARFVWDLRDFTWEYGKEGDAFSGGVASGRWSGGKVMWATASGADLVVCANDGLAEIVRQRVPKTRVEVVRNGVEESLLQMFDPSSPASNMATASSTQACSVTRRSSRC